MDSRKILKVKLLGNWALTKSTIGQLPEDLKRSYRAAQDKFANKLMSTVKNHILRQDLGWEELAASTQKRKARKGTTDILLDSRTYFESINKYQQDYSVQIGVKRGIINPTTGVEVAKYAAYLEFGTSEMPARAVWYPSLNELGGKKAIANQVIMNVRRSAQKRGYAVWL